MADDAPTTILDLPDDMLYEIFGRVLGGHVDATAAPTGAHLALRSVCRRWRDPADWSRLVKGTVCVDPSKLADASTVRARHPTALKMLRVATEYDTRLAHSQDVPLALASLLRSADLRRALKELRVAACCASSIARAVPTITPCSGLTELGLEWCDHKRRRTFQAGVLAPLSALTALRVLYLACLTPFTPLPALPDAPRLTSLSMLSYSSYAPVGSSAALGRLRRLSLSVNPTQAGMAAEDPFGLRASLDDGSWQPRRLTGLQELKVSFTHGYHIDNALPRDVQRRRSRVGAEWAPLASQVTSLSVMVGCQVRTEPSTGIVAGLGALTALRELFSQNFDTSLEATEPDGTPFGGGSCPPIDIGRVRAPAVTQLYLNSVTDAPVNAAAFANIEKIAVLTKQPFLSPLALRPLAARTRLRVIVFGCLSSAAPVVNFADLFAGGATLPALQALMIQNCALEWDTTDLAGTPTATAFGRDVRQWVPRLVNVVINEPTGPFQLPARSSVANVAMWRERVKPALLRLSGGTV